MSTEIKLDSEYTTSTANISNSNLIVNKNQGTEIYDLTRAESIDIDYDKTEKGVYGAVIAVGLVVALGSWFLFPDSLPQFAITYLQPVGFGIGITSVLYGIYKLARLRNGVSIELTFTSGKRLQFRTEKDNSSIFEQAFFRSNKGGSTSQNDSSSSEEYTPSVVEKDSESGSTTISDAEQNT